MKLEELLYQQLIGDATLAGLLGAFGSRPAVFEQYAPDDTAEGWGTKYPRMEFTVVWQEDHERRVAGIVTVDIITEEMTLDPAAEIDGRLRTLLDGAAFQPDGGTVSLRWSRADPIEVPDTNYRGIQAMFDLIAWPAGLTFSPDPVAALRSWTIGRWPALQVDPATWSPSDEAPAVYWRLAGLQDADRNAAVAWFDGTLAGHVLAPSPQVRLEWIRRLAEGLVVDRIVTLDDGSPLFVQRIRADSEADPFRQGQVQVTGRFGVLVPEVAGVPVQTVQIGGAVTGTILDTAVNTTALTLSEQ